MSEKTYVLCSHCRCAWVEKPPLPSPHTMCESCRQALSQALKDDAFKRGVA